MRVIFLYMNVNVTCFINWGYNGRVGLFLVFVVQIPIACTREVLIKRKGSCGRKGHTFLFLTLRYPCHHISLQEILELFVAGTAGRKASADGTLSNSFGYREHLHCDSL